MTTMPPAPPVQVERWTNGAAWEQFVGGARDANIGHRWAWLGIVSEVYGHRTFPLAAIRDGVLAGVLPLVLVRSRLFGRHLVSMPFLDSGGLCTDGDVASEQALAATAVELAGDHGAKLELRHLADRRIGLPASLEKVTMTLDLGGGEDAVWKRNRSTRRGQVRKARRNSNASPGARGRRVLPGVPRGRVDRDRARDARGVPAGLPGSRRRPAVARRT